MFSVLHLIFKETDHDARAPEYFRRMTERVLDAFNIVK